jgi:hypothetical protein
MIKLKDILLEGKPPSIFVPRRMEDRIERMIRLYIRNGSKGDLNLSELDLTELPEILKNISVGGHLFCGGNNLTSLKNAPSSVGGGFYCSHTKLTSLEGATTSVGVDFHCSNNKLESLEFAPTSVGGDFYCSSNKLTSLKNAPKSVGGDFWCEANTVKFTQAQVRAICVVKGAVYT